MSNTGKIIVNASLNVTAAAAQDYSTLLIVDASHTSFVRASVYTAPEDYASLDQTSALARALNSAFSAPVRPAQVIAGRSKGTTIMTPVDIADGEQYAFNLQEGSLLGPTAIVLVTASGGDTAQDVCDAIKVAFDVYTDVTDHITATVVGTGTDAVIEFSLNSTTDDYMISSLSGNLEVAFRTTETPADSLNEITDANDQWTWLTATDHTPSYQAAMAAQAQVLQQPYVTSTQRTENYQAWNGTDAPDPNDIGAVFAFNSYDYAHAVYHDNADQLLPENLRITLFSWLKPGQSSFQDKTPSGVPLAQAIGTGRKLNATELTNLEARNMSTTVQLGGQTIFGGRINATGNRMASGVRIEAVAVLIYTRQEIARLTETIFLKRNKIALNDSDIGLFVKKWDKFFQDNKTSGGTTRAFEEANPVTINVPAAKDISFEDKVAGFLHNVEIIGYMDPSIDSTIINLSLTYSDPTEI